MALALITISLNDTLVSGTALITLRLAIALSISSSIVRLYSGAVNLDSARRRAMVLRIWLFFTSSVATSPTGVYTEAAACCCAAGKYTLER